MSNSSTKTISCPDWSDDRIRTPEFRVKVAKAIRIVEAVAPRHIVNSDTLRNWHEFVFYEFVPLSYYAGNFRQVNPKMPCLNTPIFVGSASGSEAYTVSSDMITLLEEMRAFVSRIEILWPTITSQDQIKYIAYGLSRLVGGFIKIHPFLNGNGRMSRLLWFWGMRRFGWPPMVAVAVRPTDPSYSHVMAAAMHGDYNPLFVYILKALAAYKKIQA